MCDECKAAEQEEKAELYDKLRNLDSFIEFSFETQLNTETEWEERWTHIDTSIDPVQLAGDLYLLFGLSNGAFVKKGKDPIPSDKDVEKAALILGVTEDDLELRRSELEQLRATSHFSSLAKFEADAATQYRELIKRNFNNFFEYVILACGGEFRHAVKSLNNYPHVRRAAWAESHTLYLEHGVKFLLFMEEAFLKILNDGSFGGPPWASAVRLAIDYLEGKLGADEASSQQMFLDRVITMQHNNGSLLNKLHWANNREYAGIAYNYHYADMHVEGRVLDAHAANPTDIDHLWKVASQDVQDLVLEYLDYAVSNHFVVRGKWTNGTVVIPEINTTAFSALVTAATIDWDSVDNSVFADKAEELLKQVDEDIKAHVAHIKVPLGQKWKHQELAPYPNFLNTDYAPISPDSLYPLETLLPINNSSEWALPGKFVTIPVDGEFVNTMFHHNNLGYHGSLLQISKDSVHECEVYDSASSAAMVILHFAGYTLKAPLSLLAAHYSNIVAAEKLGVSSSQLAYVIANKIGFTFKSPANNLEYVDKKSYMSLGDW